MREIKFRGKRYGDGAWVYGSLYQGTKEGEKYSLILNDSGYHLTLPDDRNLAIAFAENEVNVVIPDTIGQFTGLHDKNGKEIYEGDVLFVREWKNLAMGLFDHEEREQISLEDCKGECLHESQRVVSFEEGSMCAGDYYISTLWDKQDKRHQYPIFEVEVVGNIHDNPELLNK